VPDRSERTRSQANKMRLPVILSLAGHIVVVTLLILFMTETHLPQMPLEKHGIAVTFAPLAALQAALAPARPIEPLAPPTVASQPPEEAIPSLPAPEAASAAVAQVPVVPPEQTVTAEAPPPPKPAIKPKPKYVVRRQETPQPPPASPREVQPLPANLAASQYAAPSAAASVPGPDPTVNYGTLVRAWFESHKRYPDSARERGEEGSVRLRFRVDRYGRVIDYALVTSTGYADLDQSVEQMMSGAQLPPFPAGMTEPAIELSVNIGFSLLR
jgi:periplasmic protein TonB